MASNFVIGSTSSPCRTSSAEPAQLVEEYDGKGNTDPEKLLQCPFDKNHKIRSSRFPYHIIKCRKNHPKLARELKTCPFNARHLVPKHELAHHTETCEDRVPVDMEEDGSSSSNGPCNWHVPVSTWVNPNMTEDWDQGNCPILQRRITLLLHLCGVKPKPLGQNRKQDPPTILVHSLDHPVTFHGLVFKL
ncbi:gametocyte-specific factor 1 isoform X1 [Simochromis diagramma]|uniref:gametocyte-specific factor 1 isoform X1 n=1 Tax=Simochromis diagramma TaxID=43689 RepID=UPI001A7E3ABF|nr:gametocyte-specific factor 1 isoform X1 [Simochromis diagramma]XP_039894002.1 gametocyte-specific factor 1 isoform X1 [Simochromis diagramma]